MEEDKKEAFLSKAEMYLKEGLYQTAQDLAVDWLINHPGDAEARMIACHAWMRLGKFEKVKIALKEVDEELFRLSLIYAKLGDICIQSGLRKEAINFYQRFININPTSSLSEEIKEKIQALLTPESDDESDEDSELDSSKPAGLLTVTMAELYMKQGYRLQAMRVLQEILQKDSTNERAKKLLAELEGGRQHPWEKRQKIIETLNHWLEHLNRLKSS